MSKFLTNADLYRAARTLGCEVAAIRAVEAVESSSSGFLKDGRPVIRFEPHVYRRYAGQEPPAAGNGYAAYTAAWQEKPEAAMLATSWGRYQIMGFNHKLVGYGTVSAFVTAMTESESKQLNAFVAFVQGRKLTDELQRKDWNGFAYGYNGAGYAMSYPIRMAQLYAGFAGDSFPDDERPLTKKKTTARRVPVGELHQRPG